MQNKDRMKSKEILKNNKKVIQIKSTFCTCSISRYADTRPQ